MTKASHMIVAAVEDLEMTVKNDPRYSDINEIPEDYPELLKVRKLIAQLHRKTMEKHRQPNRIYDVYYRKEYQFSGTYEEVSRRLHVALRTAKNYAYKTHHNEYPNGWNLYLQNEKEADK